MSAAANELASVLSQKHDARTLKDVLAANGEGLRSRGVYSIWVDSPGAADLTAGLAHELRPGLIYAGQAGATRPLTLKPSTGTVWGRIKTMHLGKNHNLSTLRWSLGAVLAETWGERGVNEVRLTPWMIELISVVAVTGLDSELLDEVETEVLLALDPPLNLAKVDKRTPLRVRLSELRKKHN